MPAPLLQPPEALRLPFRALRHPLFRLYWFGQLVSVSGTWMQTTAMAWLVYRLSDSPFVLGVLTAARFGPALLGAPLAGAVTDRLSRVSLVIVTQSTAMMIAATLAVLTLSGTPPVAVLLALAMAQGVVDTVDMPARQTLQIELVGARDLQSAISLNSAGFNLARMIGPSIAGIVVATFGEGVCFALNSVSYASVLAALIVVKGRSGARLPSSEGRMSLGVEIVEGWRFAWSDPRIRAVLAAVAVTSAAGLAYMPLLPVLARDVLHVSSRGYGLLLAAGGLGAVLGALCAAARATSGVASRVIAVAQCLLGVSLVLLATSRSLAWAVVWMVGVGTAVAMQLATTNGFVQTTAPDRLRGRVVSLYIWLFIGLAPVGGFLAGWAAEHVGAPWVAAVAGGSCVGSAILYVVAVTRLRRSTP